MGLIQPSRSQHYFEQYFAGFRGRNKIFPVCWSLQCREDKVHCKLGNSIKRTRSMFLPIVASWQVCCAAQDMPNSLRKACFSATWKNCPLFADSSKLLQEKEGYRFFQAGTQRKNEIFFGFQASGLEKMSVPVRETLLLDYYCFFLPSGPFFSRPSAQKAADRVWEIRKNEDSVVRKSCLVAPVQSAPIFRWFLFDFRPRNPPFAYCSAR